jgi:hypothetical protein
MKQDRSFGRWGLEDQLTMATEDIKPKKRNNKRKKKKKKFNDALQYKQPI